MHGHNALKEKGQFAVMLICSDGDCYMCMMQHQLEVLDRFIRGLQASIRA